MAANWSDGDAGTLWHLNMKINTDFCSFTTKWHMKGAALVDVRAKAVALCTRWKWIMPPSCSIEHATLNKDDHDQDSRQLSEVFGPGLFGSNKAGGAQITKFNRATDHLLVRFEHAAGNGVTRKIGPVPDEVVSQQQIVGTVPPQNTDTTPIAPVTAPGIVYVADTTWIVEMGNLIQYIGFATIAVKAGHPPGGAYKFAPWLNCLPANVGGKKGARLLPSPLS